LAFDLDHLVVGNHSRRGAQQATLGAEGRNGLPRALVVAFYRVVRSVTAVNGARGTHLHTDAAAEAGGSLSGIAKIQTDEGMGAAVLITEHSGSGDLPARPDTSAAEDATVVVDPHVFVGDVRREFLK